MCGIAGFYKKNKESKSPFCSSDVERLQKERGPDGCGNQVLHDGRVILFHQRLSIIDLSEAGRQPMTTQCNSCSKNVWLTYNGEIYNYKELKLELIKKGHTFFSESDSEVIIHGYTEYGLKVFSMLNGIYSLALFDGRKENRPAGISTNDLIVVRGPLGVKPLFYSFSEQCFSFASDMKTLLLDQSLSREIDHQAVSDYLTYLWCPAPRTMLKAVKKLEPGCLLIIREGVIEAHKQYYEIPLCNVDDKTKRSEGDLIEETRYMIQSAVERQMVSDVPIGAFLSGGLDSSSIVACMKKINPYQEIDCYTIKHEHIKSEGFVDDFPYAEKVAKALGVKLHAVEITPEIFKHVPEMIYHLEEPQSTLSPINTSLIASKAKEHGYKVLMSGAGGDDIFSGYSRHDALQMERFWQWLPKSALSSFEKISKNMPYKNNPFLRRLTKLFSNCSQSDDGRLVSFFDWFSDEGRDALLVNHQKNNSALMEKLNALNEVGNYSRLDKMLYLDCQYFLGDHCFAYTDKMTMNHSIETRVPLVDLELVKFAFSLPDHLKQNGRVGKYIFKKSMESYLPKEIIYRKKAGFGAPIRSWLESGMGNLMDQLFSKKCVEKRGLFNYDAIKFLRAENSAGRVDASYIIQAIVFIEIWCQIFIDEINPESVPSF